MGEPCICVQNLAKAFGSRRVVDELSCSVQKGEVFALMGHNGAGKSTTIDLILGLKSPDGGSARILGVDARKHRKQVFEKVGVQLQHTQYQSSITAEEACMEYAALYHAPADYQKLLDQFGLSPLRKSLVSKLSGGGFPAGLRALAKVMPLGIGIDLLKSVSMGCYDKMAVPVITLIAITGICGAVAVKTFRWE